MRHAFQMPVRFLLSLAALLLHAPLLANDGEATLEGHWAFRIDEATIFVFALDERDEQDGGGWEGNWTRPETVTSNGMVFRNMSGRQTVVPMEAIQRRDAVQLTFEGPQADGRRDILQFRLTGENQARLDYIGIEGEPFPLIRVQPDTPLGPFDPMRIYDRDNAIVQAEFGSEEESPESPAVMDANESETAPEDEDAPSRIDKDFLDGL